MPFSIVRQDITKMNVDAIVNAANTALKRGGGVCGAIFSAAGVSQLQKACDELAPIETGEAVITPGFALPAKYIIHTAGPVYNRFHKMHCRKLLRSSYLKSLALAEQNGCESIAFPLISSGIYGYPKDEALEVARLAIGEYLSEHEMQVYLAVFDKSAFVLSEALLGSVESYVNEHYVETHDDSGRRSRQFLRIEEEALRETASWDAGAVEEALQERNMPVMPAAASMPMPAAMPMMTGEQGLSDLIGNLDEPFSDALLKLIDAKGKTDVEVYKKANIDRKLFSKIRTGKDYTPKKATILAFAIALELTLSETDDLLKRAGYAISHASKFDVIIEYFIIHRKYDIYELNEVLFRYDQPLLGA